jgi:hypothetical protein
MTTSNEPCKTQKRNSRAVCQGLRKGHKGDHNFVLPDGTKPVDPPKPPKVADLTIDQQLDLIAEGITHDVRVLMNWFLDDPGAREDAARRAQKALKDENKERLTMLSMKWW